MFPSVGRAAARVLERLGHRVSVARGSTCCGQPAWNSGFHAEAARVARTTLRALNPPGDGVVCIPSGSCTTMIRTYWPEMFHLVGDEAAAREAEELSTRLFEFSELVARSPSVPGRFEKLVAYHRSCHMTRELGIVDQPVALLQGLEGCRLVDWADDLCCGFGGTFAVKQPEVSVAMADAKVRSLLESDAEVVVGCDQSCLMHLEGRMRRLGVAIPVRHLAVVLDEAAEGIAG
jgi:L-lactate dehydrogenase complex protein LldE